jgi:hypothetical protein
VEVGQTSDTFNNGGGGGGYYNPTCEISTYVGFDGTDGYGAAFGVDLGYVWDGCYTPMDMTYYDGGAASVTENMDQTNPSTFGNDCTDQIPATPSSRSSTTTTRGAFASTAVIPARPRM